MIPSYSDEGAFPRPAARRVLESEREEIIVPEQYGLTKRELFAAMAMQGILAGGKQPRALVASEAVEMADALISRLRAQL